MPEPIERGRTSVWEYVHPLSVIDRPLSAYSSPFAAVIYGPYSALAAGRGITYPGVFPTFSGIPGIARTSVGAQNLFNRLASGIPGQFRNNRASSFIGAAIRTGLFGAAAGQATFDARLLAESGNIFSFLTGRSFQRFSDIRARGQVKSAEALISSVRKGAGTIQAALSETAGVAARVPGRLTLGTIGRASLIHIGRIVSPVMNALAVAQIAYWGAEAAYKGIQSVGEMIDRSTERIHSLELGGDLSRNFLTRQAATERQRALNAIQASHLSGRRFMGNEASIVHQ